MAHKNSINFNYKLVWSSKAQMYIPVAETSSSVGKRKALKSAMFATMFATSTLLAAPPVNELPSGASIQHGQANIVQNNNTLNINQQSNKLITNWNSFNIGSNATVNFKQPSSSSVALNRITNGSASQIFGNLNANGKVFLVNPNGIVFGKGAKVDTGGLVASTLDISNSNFINENYKFIAQSSNVGTIYNLGDITSADNSYVAFIAPKIKNEGLIQANHGSVLLAAGEEVSINFDGNGLINFTIDKNAIDTLIENKNLIQVNDGIAMLSAKAVNTVTNSVINNSGNIEANSMVSKGGKILLTADTINIESTSRLDASGKTGGGQIQIGGSWQNNDSSIAQAVRTTVEKGATLDASATTIGDGGEIVVWSDIYDSNSITSVFGKLLAKGGSQAGDGGQIETSGHLLSLTNIYVNTLAKDGVNGNWLLDPTDITIDSTLAATIASNLSTTDQTITTSSGGSDDGDIDFSADIIYTGSRDALLRLNADGDIAMSNQNISSSNAALSIYFNSDRDDNQNGAIRISSESSISTNGGYFYAYGGSSGTDFAYGGGSKSEGFYLNGSILTSGGNVEIKAKGKTSSNGEGVYIEDDSIINASGGNITITGEGYNYYGVRIESDSGTATSPGTQIITDGSGTITIRGTVDAVADSDSDEFGIKLGEESGTIGALIQTENGKISLNGTGGNYSPSDSSDETNVSGVDLQYSKIQTTGNGDIEIIGTAPTANAGDGGDRDGVNIENQTVIQTGNGTGGTGSITITGTAYGNGEGVDTEDSGDTKIIAGSGGVTITGNNNNGTSDGLQLGGIINSMGGDITLTGNGGTGSDLPSGGDGIYLHNTTVGSINTNNINITGTSRSNNGSTSDAGVYLYGDDSSNYTSLTTSLTGSIDIDATGNGDGNGMTSDSQYNQIISGSGGIDIDAAGGSDGEGAILSGTFKATKGNIDIDATAGANDGDGLYMEDITIQTVSSGNINLTGTSTDDDGIEIKEGSFDSSITSAGDISINGTTNNNSDDHGIELEEVDITTTTGKIELIGRSHSSAQGIDMSKGDVDIRSSSGDITLKANTVDFEGDSNSIDSSGILKILPYDNTTSIELGGTSATLNLSDDYFGDEFGDGFEYIQVGDTNGTGGITVAGSITSVDSLKLLQGNGNIDISDTLNISTSNDYLVLNSSATVSDTGNIISSFLELSGGGDFTLDSSSNDVGTLAANTDLLSFVNMDDLIIGTVNSTNGISTTNTINVSTLSGNLTLNKNITTSDTTNNAITLNASQSSNALDSTGGDIKGNGKISTGSGGRATLYTGSISGSSAIASTIGSGSQRFRYASDETTSNYTAGLGTGNYLIYREQPTVTIKANDQSKVYDGIPYAGGNGVTGTNLLNGDSLAQFSGSVNYSGTSQGATERSTYIITPSGLTDRLGYNVVFANGNLVITKPKTDGGSLENENKTSNPEIINPSPETKNVVNNTQIISHYNSIDNVLNMPGVGKVNTLQVVVYKPNEAPYAEKGFRVKQQEKVVSLKPVDTIEEGFAAPGKTEDSYSFKLEGLSFDAIISENGLVLKPLSNDGKIKIQEQRDLVVTEALTTLLKKSDLEVSKIRTVYLDLK